MPRWVVLFGVMASLGAPVAAGAASRFGWSGGLGASASYLEVRASDQATASIEDVQSQESVSNSVTFDNAYLHIGTTYDVTAVQLQQNAELDYYSHNLSVDADVNRLLRHYMENSHLTITATARASPSLPPLQSVPVADAPTPTTPPPDPEAGTPVATPDLAREDLLTLPDQRTGYTMVYGAAYSEELDPFRHYSLSGLVTDNRYRSSLVGNTVDLAVDGTYGVYQANGEIGVRASHGRLLKGGFGGQVYGLSVFRAGGTRRLTWRVEPGITYARDLNQYSGSFRSEMTATAPDVQLSAGYGTELALNVVERQAVVRSHTAYLGLSNTRSYRFPRLAAVSGSVAGKVRRAELTLNQEIRFRATLSSVISYARSGLWWEETGTGSHQKRTSDVITFNIQWSFL